MATAVLTTSIAMAQSSGTISGVVVAERESRSGTDQLLVATPSHMLGQPIDEIRLDLPKRLRGKLQTDRLPAGWGLDWKGSTAILAGPPTTSSDVIGIALGKGRAEELTDVGIEMFSGGRPVYQGRGAPARLGKVGTSDQVRNHLRLPQAVEKGETVEFEPLDRQATPPGGKWRIGDDTATWNGDIESPRYEWKVGLGYKFNDDFKLRVRYDDPWGESLVDGETEDVEIGESTATEQSPSITNCTPKILSGGALCVCGSFPTPQSRRGITLNGRPLGEPVSASNHVLNFLLPGETPPGQFTIGGMASAGFGETDRAEGIHLVVGGNVDRDRLRRGQSTPLRLWITGSEEPVSLRLWNSTPEIISLSGGDDQIVTTSGGSPNEVVRTVQGHTPGDFILNYELDLGSCPCAEGTVTTGTDEGAGDSPTTSISDPPTTRTRPPEELPTDCDELYKKCKELEAEAERLRTIAEELRARADRADFEAERFREQLNWLDELSEKDRAYAETMKRQAAEWRELAENARRSADRNAERHRRYPGYGWDYWEAVDRAEAVRRDAQAEALDQSIRDLEAKTRANGLRAADLRELIDAADAADLEAARAEAAERAASDAWLACLANVARLCPDTPETSDGGTTTTGGGGTTISEGDDGGDDPRDTPPPVTYGEEEDEEEFCPQRDGNHPQCVGLIIDMIKEDWFPGSLDEAHMALRDMGCDIEHAAPDLNSMPPPSYMTETEIFDWSNMEFKTVRHWVDTRASRNPVLRHNRAEMAKVNGAIERHRAKLRAGAVMAVQMVFAHGSRLGWTGCGTWSQSAMHGYEGADWTDFSIKRKDFHQANYDAAKGNVCAWYVADLSCYSWQTPRAIDHLNNSGVATCTGQPGVDRSYHAAYESDIAQSCSHRGVWEVCNPYQTTYLLDDIEDAFQDESYRYRAADMFRNADSAFDELIPDLREAANSSAFSFSTYADYGYEMCVNKPHTQRGPYLGDD